MKESTKEELKMWSIALLIVCAIVGFCCFMVHLDNNAKGRSMERFDVDCIDNTAKEYCESLGYGFDKVLWSSNKNIIRFYCLDESITRTNERILIDHFTEEELDNCRKVVV